MESKANYECPNGTVPATQSQSASVVKLREMVGTVLEMAQKMASPSVVS